MSIEFRKILIYQVSWKSVQWETELFHADGQTWRILIIVFRSFAKVPKKQSQDKFDILTLMWYFTFASCQADWTSYLPKRFRETIARGYICGKGEWMGIDLVRL
jgi:hypothetical protein